MNQVEEHMKKSAKAIKCGLEFKKAFEELYDSLHLLSPEEIEQVQNHPDAAIFKKHMDVVNEFIKQLAGIKPYQR